MLSVCHWCQNKPFFLSFPPFYTLFCSSQFPFEEKQDQENNKVYNSHLNILEVLPNNILAKNLAINQQAMPAPHQK